MSRRSAGLLCVVAGGLLFSVGQDLSLVGTAICCLFGLILGLVGAYLMDRLFRSQLKSLPPEVPLKDQWRGILLFASMVIFMLILYVTLRK
jgi:H+/Cl- antiporter ClcA